MLFSDSPIHQFSICNSIQIKSFPLNTFSETANDANHASMPKAKMIIVRNTGVGPKKPPIFTAISESSIAVRAKGVINKRKLTNFVFS